MRCAYNDDTSTTDSTPNNWRLTKEGNSYRISCINRISPLVTEPEDKRLARKFSWYLEGKQREGLLEVTLAPGEGMIVDNHRMLQEGSEGLLSRVLVTD